MRKVLHTSGKDRCFGEVEFEIWLDSKKQLVRHEVHGGRWLTVDEYEPTWLRPRHASRKPLAADGSPIRGRSAGSSRTEMQANTPRWRQCAPIEVRSN